MTLLNEVISDNTLEETNNGIKIVNLVETFITMNQWKKVKE